MKKLPPAAQLSPENRLPPLLASVQRQLRNSGYSELHQLRCSVDEGAIKLTGRVSSYYLKQLAQAAIARVDEVPRIVNSVVVDYPHPPENDPARN